jgi:hypothetical protein
VTREPVSRFGAFARQYKGAMLAHWDAVTRISGAAISKMKPHRETLRELRITAAIVITVNLVGAFIVEKMIL